MLPHVVDRALRDHLAAEAAGARAEVDDVVGRLDGVRVVLHHDDRVAQVAQPAQGRQQTLVVALMQADARLVQDVEHAHEPRADLGRQPDALGLAAGERGRAAAQREVVETDIAQEAQAVHDLLQDRPGDLRVEPPGLPLVPPR